MKPGSVPNSPRFDISYGVSVCAHLCVFAILLGLNVVQTTSPQLLVVMDISGGGGGGGDPIGDMLTGGDAPSPHSFGAPQLGVKRATSRAPVEMTTHHAPEALAGQLVPMADLIRPRPTPEPIPTITPPRTIALSRTKRGPAATIEPLEASAGFSSNPGPATGDINGQADGQGEGQGGSGGGQFARGNGNGSGSGGGQGAGQGVGRGDGTGAWFGKFPGLGSDNLPPQYPAAALAAGREGLVRIRVRVAATGDVASLELETSSGDALLDQAALAAVKDWRFKPAERRGIAVAAEVVVPVRFSIRQHLQAT